jgi:excisionase family DNA binding protein
MAPISPIISPEQLSKLIQWHPETVREAIRRGRIKAVKIGPYWRITRPEVDRIMENGLPCLSQ